MICGRRSGKSFISSFCASLTALTYQSESPGDMPQVFIVAQDKQAGKVNLAYVEAFCDCIEGAITKRNKESIELSNGVEIRTQTCSFRSSRGYHLIFLAAEEMASWRDENSANPDLEVMRALDPALEPGAKTLITSTPFARRGLLYSLYRENFGRKIRYARLASADPSNEAGLQRKENQKGLREGPRQRQHRMERPVQGGHHHVAVGGDHRAGPRATTTVLPCQSGVRYFAAVDVSGGRVDSYCLTIAHSDSGIAVVDLVEERRSPSIRWR